MEMFDGVFRKSHRECQVICSEELLHFITITDAETSSGERWMGTIILN